MPYKNRSKSDITRVRVDRKPTMAEIEKIEEEHSIKININDESNHYPFNHNHNTYFYNLDPHHNQNKSIYSQKDVENKLLENFSNRYYKNKDSPNDMLRSSMQSLSNDNHFIDQIRSHQFKGCKKCKFCS